MISIYLSRNLRGCNIGKSRLTACSHCQLPHSVLVNLRLVKSSHVAMSCKTNGLHLLLFDEERINKPTDSYIGWTQTAMYLCTCPSVVNLNRIAPIDHHLG